MAKMFLFLINGLAKLIYGANALHLLHMKKTRNDVWID